MVGLLYMLSRRYKYIQQKYRHNTLFIFSFFNSPQLDCPRCLNTIPLCHKLWLLLPQCVVSSAESMSISVILPKIGFNTGIPVNDGLSGI